jgi:ATP-binding cassette subfamily B protein
VLALIVLSSGLSMISPFLLSRVLDDAIPQHNVTLLTELVLGMIAIASRPPRSASCRPISRPRSASA